MAQSVGNPCPDHIPLSLDPGHGDTQGELAALCLQTVSGHFKLPTCQLSQLICSWCKGSRKMTVSEWAPPLAQSIKEKFGGYG